MLEETTVMEKKIIGRATQVPVKAGTEKKSAEPNSSSRTHGKNARRREISSSSVNKNEQVRKTSNRGGKYTDKRPRPRGQYYGCGKQEAKVDFDGHPEYGSVYNPGNKKQNLNHLLNFTLTPRGSNADSVGRAYGRDRQVHYHWLGTTHKHKYNKEQFLQANCQFVVKSGVDYSVYLCDPDLLVEWPYIEQIRLRSNEHVLCPICLEAPVAAKMTRCGHVYCWPCILHYLALSDKSWRKCPICFESVHRRDLKSVTIVSDVPSRVGEKITFRLMKRERDAFVAYPVTEDDETPRPTTPLSVNEKLQSTAYVKLLVAPREAVKQLLSSERYELETGLKSVQGEPEYCFFEEALSLLSEREDDQEKIKHETESAIEEEDLPQDGDDSPVEPTAEFDCYAQAFDEEETDELEAGLPNVSPEDVEIESQVTGQKPFFFYQAADGQNIFLSALNLRMLEMQYGSLQTSPLSITGKVLEKESGSMTRELRGRLRSLSHLPLTSAFELLELDMTPILSADIISVFSEALSNRADRRRRRERIERQHERRIKREVGSQWGREPTPRIRLDSTRHFPKCGEEDAVEHPLAEADTSHLADSRSQSMNSLASSHEPEPVSSSPVRESSGPSFAQMLKVGGSSGLRRQQTWPKPSTTTLPDDDHDAGTSAARMQPNFSDVIAEALNRFDLMNIDDRENTSKKKNKRKKQKILFSSGMAFTTK